MTIVALVLMDLIDNLSTQLCSLPYPKSTRLEVGVSKRIANLGYINKGRNSFKGLKDLKVLKSVLKETFKNKWQQVKEKKILNQIARSWHLLAAYLQKYFKKNSVNLINSTIKQTSKITNLVKIMTKTHAKALEIVFPICGSLPSSILHQVVQGPKCEWTTENINHYHDLSVVSVSGNSQDCSPK